MGSRSWGDPISFLRFFLSFFRSFFSRFLFSFFFKDHAAFKTRENVITPSSVGVSATRDGYFEPDLSDEIISLSFVKNSHVI
jgi:hypothetical protein